MELINSAPLLKECMSLSVINGKLGLLLKYFRGISGIFRNFSELFLTFQELSDFVSSVYEISCISIYFQTICLN